MQQLFDLCELLCKAVFTEATSDMCTLVRLFCCTSSNVCKRAMRRNTDKVVLVCRIACTASNSKRRSMRSLNATQSSITNVVQQLVLAWYSLLAWYLKPLLVKK